MNSLEEARKYDITSSTEKTKRYRITARAAIIVVATVVTAVVLTFFPSVLWVRADKPQQPPAPSAAGQQQEVKKGLVLPNNAPDLPRAWNPDGTMTDPSTWMRIEVPPHGDSVRVPAVFGYHLVWSVGGFKLRHVYADGHECKFGDTGPACGDGDIVAGYAHNDGDTPLIASYAYAKKGEK